MEPEPTRRELLAALTAAGAVPAAGTAADGTATAESPEGGWPMFGYDPVNTGHNPDATGIPADPGMAWGAATGGPVRASPAVVDGVVYVGSTDGTVYAFDTADREELWTVTTGGPVRSGPAVADGLVYAGSDDGTVYALGADSGDVEWTFDTGGPVRAAPTVAGGTVYVGSRDESVYAIDAADGSEEWTVETGGAVEAAAAVVTEGDTRAPPEGVVYVGSRDSRLYALDAADGSNRWEFVTGEPIAGGPAVVGDRVYVGSLNGQVYGLTTEGGDERWSFATGGAVVTSPAVADGRVYVASRDGAASRVHAIDDGLEAWVFEAGGELTEPAVADGRVYAGSRDGHVYALDAANEGEVWSVSVDAAVQSSPAVAGDRLYLGTEAGTVYALVEGGEDPTGIGNGGDGLGEDDGEPDDGISIGDFTFLLWPASAIAFVAAVLGGLYVASRAGLLDRIEAAADDVEPAVTLPDDGESTDADGAGAAAGGGDEGDGPGGQTPVWELVVADVIGRAERADRTATRDLLVTKYVDSGTLDSPVVAYEVESFREAPARVRIVEPLFDSDEEGNGSQPLGDGWTVESDGLVFEAVLEPDESLQTLVGRPDCPEARLEDLLERPEITVEDVD